MHIFYKNKNDGLSGIIMSDHDYLARLLNGYELGDEETNSLNRQMAKMEKFHRERYGSKVREYYYSGSFAKGTAINLKYDYDLVLFFKPGTFKTTAEMYESVYDGLKSLGDGPVLRQRVALRLQDGGESIDIVPAMLIKENSDRVILNIIPFGEIQTDIKAHKKHVMESRRSDVIKLVKIWKQEHGLHFKAFALEHLVIQAMDGFDSPDLGRQFEHVLTYIKDNVEKARILDPGNRGNDIANMVSSKDKANFRREAASSLSQWRQQSVREVIS